MSETTTTQLSLPGAENAVDYQLEEPGTGFPRPTCGILISVAHVVGDQVHGQSRISRCHRIECPRCFDQPSGWASRAQDRIEAGIGKGMPGEAFVPEFLRELTVAVNGDAELVYDAAWRRDMLRRLVKAYGPRLGRPGAWVLHARPELDRDSCPMGPHLHVFFSSSHDELLPRSDGPLLGLRVSEIRKPGLGAALRGTTLVRATSPGMRGRTIRRVLALIGWFGRRAPPRRDPATPKLEETRYCEICHSDVRKKDWSKVIPLQFRPETEGSWMAPLAEVQLRSTMEFRWKGGA